MDYIISTYVTPWAISNERNKSQYVELLQELMAKSGSKLISVDPEMTNLRFEVIVNSSTCKAHIEKMGLRPIDPILRLIVMSSNVQIWEKKAEVGE